MSSDGNLEFIGGLWGSLEINGSPPEEFEDALSWHKISVAIFAMYPKRDADTPGKYITWSSW